MIIGITGKVCSGKDTVAELLIKKKFEHISLSDFLREDLKRQKKQVTRDNLIEIGAKMRTELGPAILAERAFARMNPEKNYVLTSIGRTEEALFFKEKGIKIIYVDAKDKTRFQRMKARKRENDPKTYKDFLKLEKIESKGKKLERNFDDIKKISDIILTNDGTLKELEKKTELISKIKRPDWDEYFFGILDAVSKRSTCDRGKVGCVITKNNRILATGYAGAPPGLPQCDEVGHLMMKAIYVDDGEKEHCIRTTHAEQNAIAHAAKNGVSLNGSTIYVNVQPCLHCTKIIISSGIKKVVARNKYSAGIFASRMLKQAKIEFTVKDNSIAKY